MKEKIRNEEFQIWNAVINLKNRLCEAEDIITKLEGNPLEISESDRETRIKS